MLLRIFIGYLPTVGDFYFVYSTEKHTVTEIDFKHNLQNKTNKLPYR